MQRRKAEERQEEACNIFVPPGPNRSHPAIQPEKSSRGKILGRKNLRARLSCAHCPAKKSIHTPETDQSLQTQDLDNKDDAFSPPVWISPCKRA